MDIEKEVARIKVRVEQNHAMLKSIRRHMRVSSAFGFMKLLIVLIPIIFAIIYLPPLIQEYQDFIGTLQSNLIVPTLPQGIDLGTFQELLDKVPIER